MTPHPSYHVDITEEQTLFFRENGFLSIRRITTDAEVKWLKEVYNQLFDRRTGEKEGRYGVRGAAAATRSGSNVSRTQENDLFPECTSPRRGAAWR